MKPSKYIANHFPSYSFDKEDVVLIPMSSGIDSTYLVNIILSTGCTVQPIYIDYGQHIAKVAIETKSLQEIIDVLRNKYGVDSIRDYIYINHVGDYSSQYLFPRLLSDSCARTINNPNGVSIQPLSLILGLLAAVKNEITAVVLPDQPVEIKEDLRTLFYNLFKVTKDYISPKFLYDEDCQIKKSTKVRRLPKELLGLTWVCETPLALSVRGFERLDVYRHYDNFKKRSIINEKKHLMNLPANFFFRCENCKKCKKVKDYRSENRA